MLPAEKTHYRKGLALGLTLAETFSIVVFILLLACAVLIQREQTQRDTAEAQRDTARIDLRITQEMLRAEDVSWSNADAWFDHAKQLGWERDSLQAHAAIVERELSRARARAAETAALLATAGVDTAVAERVAEQAAELDALEDSVSRSEQRLRDASSLRDSLEARLAEAEQVGELVRDAIADRGTLSPEEANRVVEQAARAKGLSDSLANAKRAIGALDGELRGIRHLMQSDSVSLIDSLRAGLDESRFREDTLVGRIRSVERERDDAVGRAEFREREIERLQGFGIEPPPCWLDSADSPEHIFRVELTDRGMRLFNIAPAHHAERDRAAMGYAMQIEDGRAYSPADFQRLTRPYLELGVSQTQQFGPKGCRYWVQAIDRTGARKDVFKERLTQLERHFYKLWISPIQP